MFGQLVMDDFSEVLFIYQLAASRAFVVVVGLVLRFAAEPLAIQPTDGGSVL